MSTPSLTADQIRQHLETARHQIAQGQLKEAATTLNEAQRIQPNDARIFMLAGLMAEKSGNHKKALESLRICVATAPQWAPGMLELALYLARHNQFKEAIEWAEKVTALAPKNLQSLEKVVDIAHRAGNVEMAIRHLQRGLQLYPNDQNLMQLLGTDLRRAHRHDESLVIWNKLLERNPDELSFLFAHFQTLLAAGRPQEGLSSTSRIISKIPDDEVAQYCHQIALGKVPKQQPESLSRVIFDESAKSFDLHLVHKLGYQLPKIVAAKIEANYPTKKLNVLDLGCGTGLLGVFLGRIDGFMIGVEPSTKMLEQAARHNVYDRFHTIDLRDALRETPYNLYQVIAALDVFIYVGDLAEAIPNALRILTAGGHFYFSCETAPANGPDLILQSNGRYAHSIQSVERLCQQAGFAHVEIEEQVIRTEAGEPVQGFLVTATKAA